MRPGRGARVAHLADDIALLHREFIGLETEVHAVAFGGILFLLHPAGHRLAEAEQVPVDRGRAVGMGHIDAIAVTPRRNADAGDVATFDDVDVIAHLAAYAPVHAAVEMVVPEFAIGAGKRHGHIERPDGLLLCPYVDAENQRENSCEPAYHPFGVKLEDVRQLSRISFSFRSSFFGT